MPIHMHTDITDTTDTCTYTHTHPHTHPHTHMCTLTLIVFAVTLMLSLPSRALAYAHWEGYCQQGGQLVVTQSAPSTTKVQQSYPSATLTVYITGSSPLTKATIYSDNNGTPLGNPLTCNSKTAYFAFYAANSTIDLTFSGTGIAAPFTIGSVQGVDPVNVPQIVSDFAYSIEGKTLAASCAFAHTIGLTLVVSSPRLALSTQTLNCDIQILSGGVIQPASGQIVTLSGAITASAHQIFDTSLSGPGSIVLSGPAQDYNIAWWGAIGDDSDSDAAANYAAIASSFASAALKARPGMPTGGCVTVPLGIFRITQTVFGDNYVHWCGGGVQGSIIKAATTWSGGPLYFMGTGIGNPAEGAMYISFDCELAATTCTGVEGNAPEEGTIFHDVNIYGFGDGQNGLYIHGSSASNFTIGPNVTLQFLDTTTTAIPVQLSNVNGRIKIEGVTVGNLSGTGGSIVPACFATTSSQNVLFEDIHVENCTAGIDNGLGGASFGVISINVYGNSTVPTVFKNESGSYPIGLYSIAAGGSASAFNDNGISIGSGDLNFYVSSVFGKYWTDAPTLTAMTNLSDGSSFVLAQVQSPYPSQTTPHFQILDGSNAFQLGDDQNYSWYTRGVRPNSVSVSTTYQVMATDEYVLCNATGGAFTVTLPSPGGKNARQRVTIGRIDSSANAITVGGSVVGGSSVAGGGIHANTYLSNGSNWIQVSAF